MKSPKCTETAGVDGIGGVEFVLKQKPGRHLRDRPGASRHRRASSTIRAANARISADATYMGMGKWVDADVLVDMIPDKEEEIRASINHGEELTSHSDSDRNTWIHAIRRSQEHAAGLHLLSAQGRLVLGAVHRRPQADGGQIILRRSQRQGCVLVRDVFRRRRSRQRPIRLHAQSEIAQDEVNQRRSKGLHEMMTRRIIAEEGAFDDIEKARREAIRPDGVVIKNKGFDAEFDDPKKQQDIEGQRNFSRMPKAEIEDFGPGSAVLGAGNGRERSGRAIALMQQAGMAQLGPFVTGHPTGNTASTSRCSTPARNGGTTNAGSG